MNIWQRTVEEQDAEIARAKAEMKERCAQVAEKYPSSAVAYSSVGSKIAAAIRAMKDH